MLGATKRSRLPEPVLVGKAERRKMIDLPIDGSWNARADILSTPVEGPPAVYIEAFGVDR